MLVKSGTGRYVRVILKVSVAIAMIGYVLTHIDWHSTREQLRAVRPFWLAALLPLLAVRIVCSACRWRLFIPASVTLLTVVRLHLIGCFFNAFLPTTFGGDVFKSVLLKRHVPVSLLTGLVSSAADRFLGIIALTLVAVGAAILSPTQTISSGVAVPLCLLVVGCGASIAILYSMRWRSVCLGWLGHRGMHSLRASLHHIYTMADTYREKPGMGWQALGWSVAIQLGDVSVIYMLAQLLNIRMNYLTVATVSPLAAAAGLMPISLNGLGVMEGAALWLYTHAGIRGEDAALLALATRTLIVVLAVVGGVTYVWDTYVSSRIKNEEHDNTV